MKASQKFSFDENFSDPFPYLCSFRAHLFCTYTDESPRLMKEAMSLPFSLANGGNGTITAHFEGDLTSSPKAYILRHRKGGRGQSRRWTSQPNFPQTFSRDILQRCGVDCPEMYHQQPVP